MYMDVFLCIYMYTLCTYFTFTVDVYIIYFLCIYYIYVCVYVYICNVSTTI